MWASQFLPRVLHLGNSEHHTLNSLRSGVCIMKISASICAFLCLHQYCSQFYHQSLGSYTYTETVAVCLSDFRSTYNLLNKNSINEKRDVKHFLFLVSISLYIFVLFKFILNTPLAFAYTAGRACRDLLVVSIKWLVRSILRAYCQLYLYSSIYSSIIFAFRVQWWIMKHGCFP